MDTASARPFGEILGEVAAVHGANPAVVDHRGGYTFRELLEHSEALKRRLLDRGIGEGDLVALLFEQSKEAIAATIAVLRCGAAFVPMDVNDPVVRHIQVAQDCRPALFVTNSTHHATVRHICGTDRRILDVDDAESGRANPPDAAPVSADALASVFYTSGSTGSPKGVCQSHRNLLHFASTYKDALEITSEDRLSMVYSLAFSASNMDVFPALLSGAGLHLFDLKTHGPLKLLEWLTDNRITVLHTVPTVFRHMLKHAPEGFVFEHVRAVDLGGEAMYASDVELLRRHVPENCICLNHFAATEASVIAQHRVDTERDYPGGLIPVGKPAPGIEVAVTAGGGGRPAQANETGRISIRSEYLSSGYFNAPGLTDRHFRDEGAVRVFEGGDMGYWDENGDLIYVGRSDQQVKIRGHSVQMAEIESALNRHDGIDNAVVVAGGIDGGMRQAKLTAHVAVKRDAAPSESSLRHYLDERMPAYMIPRRFVLRDELPLTATGKVDRSRLREGGEAGALSGSTEAEPRSRGIREAVAGVFAEVLERPDIDANASFFELGGDSFGMTDLADRIRRTFNAELPDDMQSRDVTVAAVVEYLETLDPGREDREARGPEALIVPLKETEGLPRIFLVHGHNGRAFISPSVVEIIGKRFSVYAIRARGLKEGEIPHFSVQGMAAEYIYAIRRIQPEGPYFISGVCQGGVVAIEMAIQMTDVADVVAPIVVFDPPISNKITRIETERRRILMNNLAKYDSGELDHGLARSWARKGSEGRMQLDDYGSSAMLRASRVKAAFSAALAIYRFPVYSGDVLVITNYLRLTREEAGDYSYIPGNLKFHCAAINHKGALDATKKEVTDAFEECLEYALENVSEGNATQGAPTSKVDVRRRIKEAVARYRRSEEGGAEIRALRRREWRDRMGRLKDGIRKRLPR